MKAMAPDTIVFRNGFFILVSSNSVKLVSVCRTFPFTLRMAGEEEEAEGLVDRQVAEESLKKTLTIR